MKPPMNGASRGPVKTVIEKTVIAKPRVRLSNMSEKTAATTARGQAPNIPTVYRQYIALPDKEGISNLPIICRAESSEDPFPQLHQSGI